MAADDLEFLDTHSAKQKHQLKFQVSSDPGRMHPPIQNGENGRQYRSKTDVLKAIQQENSLE